MYSMQTKKHRRRRLTGGVSTTCPVCNGTTSRNTHCTRKASCKIGCTKLCWQHSIAYVKKSPGVKSHCQNLLPPPAAASANRRQRGPAEPTITLNAAVPALNSSVTVKRSQIAAAGKGLFAKKDFQVGDVVATYGGIVMHADEYKRLPESKRNYGMAIENHTNYIVDGTKSYGIHKGRWINDPFHTNFALNVKSKWNNADKRIEIKATKPIKKGDEIFINYGAGFHQRL